MPETEVYVLFTEGTFALLKVSKNLFLDISVPYLATSKLSVIAQGPKALRSLDIRLDSSVAGPLQLTVFLIQAGIVFGVAFLIVLALVFWKRKAESDRPPKPPVSYTEPEQPTSALRRGTGLRKPPQTPRGKKPATTAAGLTLSTALDQPLLGPGENTTGGTQSGDQTGGSNPGQNNTANNDPSASLLNKSQPPLPSPRGPSDSRLSSSNPFDKAATGGIQEGGRPASSSKLVVPATTGFRRTTNLKPMPPPPKKEKDGSDSSDSSMAQDDEFHEEDYMQGVDDIEDRLLLGEGFAQEEYDNNAAPWVGTNPDDEIL